MNTLFRRDTSDSKSAAGARSVTPEYFTTMGVPLRRGRFFSVQDDRDAPPVAIVNEEAARRYWSGEDPVGKSILPAGSFGKSETERRIIGVAGNTAHEADTGTFG